VNALHKDYRDDLEKAVAQARDVAEAGARAALNRLTVADAKPVAGLTDAQRKLRNQLRAEARSLGDKRDKTTGEQATDRLVREVAYEHWHRMLFARFLADNDLLVHPEYDTAVSLADVKELAKAEAKAGRRTDPWELAASYASAMLPQIFRTDDPGLALTFAPEHRQALEALVENLHPDVFTADDSLGWVYQYWQKDEKDRVNKSGDKITGDTLPAVTQLFTEHYMVLFLLHNTVGAWWAGKKLADPAVAEQAKQCSTEAEVRSLVNLPDYAFDYLRFLRDEETKAWKPAAGTFDGWPTTAAKLKVLDPCCGSGHFLVAVFLLLVRLRVAEEGLSMGDAIDAVLTDNLHGLELDPRCTQLAAFNVAFTAWRMNGGWKKLPRLHIACTGLAPNTPVERWHKLAKPMLAGKPQLERESIELALDHLHGLFTNAPTLGSLIDVTKLAEDQRNFAGMADYETVEPYLRRAMDLEYENGEADDLHADAVTSAGIADAARLLKGPDDGYTLVITNVPFLQSGKHDPSLRTWARRNASDAKGDLSTLFLSRSESWLAKDGSLAAVSSQTWLFLSTFKKFRHRILGAVRWNIVARLGNEAFDSITGHVVNVAMLASTNRHPYRDDHFAGIDASQPRGANDKAQCLVEKNGRIYSVPQLLQRENADSTIILEQTHDSQMLSEYAASFQGISPADAPYYSRCFWECQSLNRWHRWQSTPRRTAYADGKQLLLWWNDDFVSAVQTGHAFVRGSQAWGKDGVAVKQMASCLALTMRESISIRTQQ
jgi:hypothetical protein